MIEKNHIVWKKYQEILIRYFNLRVIRLGGNVASGINWQWPKNS